MSTLWKQTDSTLHPAVHRYIISKNLEADNTLLPYDVAASIAHADMLRTVGLLSPAEFVQLATALEKVRRLHDEGTFTLQEANEDVHTSIERFLTKELGELGKKIHVGRSRNDQVLVAMRLYSRDALLDIRENLYKLAETILQFSKTHQFIPMCGYTHMQHAMPSSVGQWASSFVESLLTDDDMLQSAYHVNDQNPLGSAAGFGTAIAIDRQATTKALQFRKPQINPIFCQNSRGKFEAYTIHTLTQLMMTLGKIANDLVVFTSHEFAFFKVADCLTTGSSIMPQKRNLDIMEVLRANVSIIHSLQMQVQMVGQNLLSGYNKDLKITKKPLMDAFSIAAQSLQIVDLLFQNLEPIRENLEKAFADTEIFATDYANQLVAEGMPFRDAYHQVKEQLDQLEPQNPYDNIKGKKHLGATGNLGLEMFAEELAQRSTQSPKKSPLWRNYEKR